MAQLPALDGDVPLGTRWQGVRALRETVTEAIEPLRRAKTIRSSLEAEVTVPSAPLPEAELAELFIVADVRVGEDVAVARTERHKCGRCWRHLPEVTVDGALCDRCTGGGGMTLPSAACSRRWRCSRSTTGQMGGGRAARPRSSGRGTLCRADLLAPLRAQCRRVAGPVARRRQCHARALVAMTGRSRSASRSG